MLLKVIDLRLIYQISLSCPTLPKKPAENYKIVFQCTLDVSGTLKKFQIRQIGPTFCSHSWSCIKTPLLKF